MSFISITALPVGTGYTLFAIDDQGKVWAYNSSKHVWLEHSQLPKE